MTVLRFLLSAALLISTASAAGPVKLAPGVRGLATRAPAKMVIDGDLSKYKDAFCTPVGYFESDLKNRPAMFFYMWDEEAFYCGLRTLDEKQANPAPDDKLWGGDAVEWYFDTRRGADFLSKDWGPGAIHMYWTAYKDKELKPRWCLRPDMLMRLPGGGQGIEVAARKTAYGAEIEFKLPWKNFPDFKPEPGAVIGLDAELCYGDGGARTYRTFAYGSPLSVQQPASQGRVQLVEKVEPEHLKQVGAVMLPIRCDTPWTQGEPAHVHGYMAVPPAAAELIGKIEFRVHDLEGKVIGNYPAAIQTLNKEGGFLRAFAKWPTAAAVPGAHFLSGAAYDKDGKLLAAVAPRLVSVNNNPGY